MEIRFYGPTSRVGMAKKISEMNKSSVLKSEKLITKLKMGGGLGQRT